MKVYISGDRRGKNAFMNAVFQLREKGFEPVNPLTFLQGGSVGTRTVFHIVSLLECDAIYLLPSWEKSFMSRMEYQIAFRTGKEILSGNE